MSVASFRVFGRLGMAGSDGEGTLSINRENGQVTVRRKRSHTVYETTLNRLADYICTNGLPTKPGREADEQSEG
jgi:hypothetical protein